MPAVWERSHVRQFWEAIIQILLAADFARAFQNDRNNISDAVERERFTG